MKTLTLYAISSTRAAGYWEDEKLDVGDGLNTQVADGFSTEAAAKKFLVEEIFKLQAQPHFFKDVKLEALPKTGPISEFSISYSYREAASSQWLPNKVKFRIKETKFQVVEEPEASSVRLH